jgi:hypothetical protein
MKILSIIFIILNCYLDHSSKVFVLSGLPLQDTGFDTAGNSAKLIGVWKLQEYKTVYFNSGMAVDSSTRECYSCPQIRFRKNKTAEVLVAGKTTEKLTWNINSEKIRLNNDTLYNNHATFPDKEYILSITRKSNFDKLELTYFEEQYSISYILYR